ncbi:MAG TPA: class I SAM-dependent methyltransferase [Methanomicrobiales archaeon]|nr:class I SAM-dependent methyltransferase [Methanomicrobiales archaeon]
MCEMPPCLTEVALEELLGNRLLYLYYWGFVRSLNLKGNERILEFGSGGGLCSRHLAEALSRGGSLTCVDISPYWMDKARDRLLSYPNVQFRLGNLGSLDLPDAGYDSIVIHFVLHDLQLPSREEILRLLSKKLKRRGTIFIREPIKPDHGIPVSEILALMHGARLKRLRSSTRSLMVMGTVFDGVFRKR